jgi:hypothetical protein
MVCCILSVSNLLQAIIAMPQRQRAVVQRLIEHCRALDGTELKVIEITQAQDDAFKPTYLEMLLVFAGIRIPLRRPCC